MRILNYLNNEKLFSFFVKFESVFSHCILESTAGKAALQIFMVNVERSIGGFHSCARASHGYDSSRRNSECYSVKSQYSSAYQHFLARNYCRQKVNFTSFHDPGFHHFSKFTCRKLKYNTLKIILHYRVTFS